jgi:ABC-2 type transport system permease protein
MISIVALTIGALTRGRRLIVVALLLAIPPLLALVYRGSEARPDGAMFSVQMVETLLLPLLIPLTALILASSALGNEVEDRTLLYLALRPIPRWFIAVGKLLAVTLVTVALIEISILFMHVISVQGLGEGRVLTAGLVAGFAGSMAYCSVFVPLGLLAPRRGLIIGLAYVLVWEAAVASISTLLATLAIRRYVVGALDATLQINRLVKLEKPSVDGLASTLVLAGVVIAATGFTTWWLGRMEIP